ncbi:hypothetical protein AB6A40_001078 [Gnathostoma spinigerum]|uniref:Uncharacterized protein n=1 Tax=Gnathostoma spinigerum TaxID=75299 RepID=A0ABD6E3C9_9BILA
MDLEQVETVLVQKMACGEPVVRTRAFNALRKWIREISSSGQLGIDSMSRLCKGLHYVMWMQDKMILQEEMADRIGSLLNDFSEEEQCAQFVKCMITCVANEWPLIDRWRMDKFLMVRLCTAVSPVYCIFR